MSYAAPANCAICGATRNLTSHHIHPREYKDTYPNGAENINERANLVVLCAGCHSAVHDKRSHDQMIRDIQTKLRRKAKERPGIPPEQLEQSLKDQEIRKHVWKQLIETLRNKESRAKIEEYRRIIRLIGRIHRAEFDNKFA